MRLLVAVLSLSFASMMSASSMKRDCNAGICVDVSSNLRSLVFVATNDRPTDAWIELTFTELRNVFGPNGPTVKRLPARSRTIVATLSIVTETPRPNYRYKWRASDGDPKAQHDGSVVYGAPVSLEDSPNAFSMLRKQRERVAGLFPAGSSPTRVLAARDGEVTLVAELEQPERAERERVWAPGTAKSHRVVIEQPDGTQAEYLFAGTVQAVPRRKVKAGDILGIAVPELPVMLSVWKGSFGRRERVAFTVATDTGTCVLH